MGDSQSQYQSLSSLAEDQAATSDLRLCSSGVETGAIQSSAQLRDANSEPGGFSGAGSSSARYRLLSPGKLPISRSPCITIPPGLSPTSFLDSPVLLSNMKAEPSPTTGSFLNPQMMRGSGNAPGFSFAANCSASNVVDVDEQKTMCFEFRPPAKSDSAPGLPAVAPMISAGMNSQSQSFAPLPCNKSEMASSSKELNLHASKATLPSGVDSDELDGVPLSTGVQGSKPDSKTGTSVSAEKSSDDGYNWRKYGQKLVKGSEFPRSYYKCTHPNCEVKKIFERSHDGQITEIVYKGTHDHPKPQPSRRFAGGAIMSMQEKTDISSLTVQGAARNSHLSHNVESNGTPELSPHGRNNDNIEGAVDQLNNTNNEGDEDDPFLKRRRLDGANIDVTPVVKPIREPRVVVQTVSEVDILDDGYRWRKYGQKVVRGNPNPRSYYKCTNAGCPVRKHVERASHDPKAVITTYEGKHNHDVPTARSSSHDMAGSATANGTTMVRSEEMDPVSLDLGVGISSVAESRSIGRQQIMEAEPVPNQASNASSSYTVVPTYFGAVNAGAYGSRENHVESRNFQTPPLNHSSNPYAQNLERILLGP